MVLLRTRSWIYLSIAAVVFAYIWQKISIHIKNEVDHFEYKTPAAKPYLNSLKFNTEPKELNSESRVMSYKIGDIFTVQLSQRPSKIMIFAKIGQNSRILWQNVPSEGYFMVGTGIDNITEWSGNYKIRSKFISLCITQTIEAVERHNSDSIVISGKIDCPKKMPLCECSGKFSSIIGVEKKGIKAGELNPHLSVKTQFVPSAEDFPLENLRLFTKYFTKIDESFFGFGHQFTGLDMRGYHIPIMTREQGLGRGLQPFTAVVNELFSGAGGHETTSYGPAPHYITSKKRSQYWTDSGLMTFDLTHEERIIAASHSTKTTEFRIIVEETMKNLISSYTLQFAGVMKPLPKWANENGICLGLEGNRKEVETRIVEMVEDHKCPIASIWIQDWVGERTLPWGTGLWWNWEWDVERFPNHIEFVKNLQTKYKIETMGYVSLMYANVSRLGKPKFRRNLYQEAFDHGYLILVPCLNKDEDCQDGKKIWNGYEGAGMTDLTNPKAREWLKKVIRTELIDTGMKGWMSDFGESLPWNAITYTNQPAHQLHNIWPRIWAEINADAVKEAGLENDVVYWMRASDGRTYEHAPMMWLGDQLATWDEFDGMQSALVGLISSGLSGAQLQHSDIGAYNGIDKFPFKYLRTKELFMRWAEFSAFTAYFRTHYGTHPHGHWQFHSDLATREHFTKFARVWTALAPYRSKLMTEDMSKHGLPLNRPLFLEFETDPSTYTASTLKNAFMLGSDLLIAPILNPGISTARLLFPVDGTWTRVLVPPTSCHLSTQFIGGEWRLADSPIGYPAVFVRKGGESEKMLLHIFEQFEICDELNLD